MTIDLPAKLESRIKAAVTNGRFTSVDEAMTEAARLLLRESSRDAPTAGANRPGLGLIGALRDDAGWLDRAVEHAMIMREERPWRLPASE